MPGGHGWQRAHCGRCGPRCCSTLHLTSHAPCLRRLAFINTCRGWLAALEAAPDLMPALVLSAPPYPLSNPAAAAAYWGRDRVDFSHMAEPMFQAFLRDVHDSKARLAQRARRLPHAPRVLIDGCDSQVRTACKALCWNCRRG